MFLFKYVSVRTKKLHNISFIKIIVEFLRIFWGSKLFVFRASCFGYFGFHSKEWLSETPFLILLEENHSIKLHASTAHPPDFQNFQQPCNVNSEIMNAKFPTVTRNPNEPVLRYSVT